jgi:hypothetical protein
MDDWLPGLRAENIKGLTPPAFCPQAHQCSCSFSQYQYAETQRGPRVPELMQGAKFGVTGYCLCNPDSLKIIV